MRQNGLKVDEKTAKARIALKKSKNSLKNLFIYLNLSYFYYMKFERRK